MNENYDLIANCFKLHPNPVFILDEELVIIETNDKGASVLGYPISEINGKHFSEFFDTFAFQNSFSNFLKSTDLENNIFFNFLIDGKLTPFKLTITKFSGAQKGFFITAEDHSKFIEVQNQLENVKGRIQQYSHFALLGEMTEGVVHELANPLTIIKNLTNKLIKNEVETEKSFLMILKQISKLQKLAINLQSFHRNQNEGQQSILVSELINDSLEMCRENLKNYEINLIIDDIDPDLKIDGKKLQLSQAIINIVNSSKQSLYSLDEKWIKVSAFNHGDSIKIKIMNSSFEENIQNDQIKSDALNQILDEHFGKMYFDQDELNCCAVIDIPKGV